MNLKPKAAAVWLAAPLVAMALIACGDDGETTPETDGGLTSSSGETGECGDGDVGDDEECDDGNTASGDGCSASCKTEEEPASCGDGNTDEGEQCDLGNANGDPGEDCTSKCKTDVHGDGHRGSDEDCDDGNRVNDDECDNTGHRPEAPATCGDSNVDADEGEECDEGNGNGVAGGTCTEACMNNKCGDGYVGEGEACDDANGIATDSCDNCQAPAEPEFCGDGIVQDDEQCDEGENNNGTVDSACTDKCKTAECGDGIRNNGEDCDEGAENGTDGTRCAIDCLVDTCGNGQVGPTEACDDGNDVATDECDACESTSCGDGEMQGDEECDSGDDNGAAGDTCTASCKLDTCGDSHVGPEEECDLGKGNGGNGSPGVNCTASCMNNVCGDEFVAGAELCDEGDANSDTGTCTTDCSLPTCTDAIVQDGEECDDGNTVNTDECTSTCTLAACGDGFVQADEECDDGNENSDTVEGACRTDCSAATCGDSVIDTDKGEECDLGSQNGIGGVCSSNCLNTSCGDGVVQDDEECDDGNTNNNDSCITNCKWNVCGDGAVYVAKTDPLNTAAVEQCDDANDSDADSCLATCKYNVCADSAVLTTITEPYGDPDANGPMTASRTSGSGGADPTPTFFCLASEDEDECANDLYHSSESGTRTFSGAGLVDSAGEASACSENVLCFPEPLENFILTNVNVEQCDDGNLVNTDACVAANFDLDGSLECHDAKCGDGLVQATVEQCDEAEDTDARENNNDSCIDTCKYNVCQDGWEYLSKTDTSNAAALEACDDGNAVGTDLCSVTCTVSGLNSDSATGISATCGDSVVQPGEGCDKGTAAGTGNGQAGVLCDIRCQITTCGDGIKQGEEQCDDGNNDNNDQCLNSCLWNGCGDGFRYIATAVGKPTNNAPLEECDDANGNNRDQCITSCKWNTCADSHLFSRWSGSVEPGESDAEWAAIVGIGGPSLAYTGPAFVGGDDPATHECDDSGDISPPPEGDRYDECWNPGDTEECDDGNTTEGDGCDSSCFLDTCGDGVVDDGEGCDDGNVVSGDGCESTCQLVAACGDGILQWGEACDGDVMINAAPGVGEFPATSALPNGVTCLDDCRVSTCHDNGGGGAQAGEQCDDQNTVNSDTCTNRCLDAVCGDGILQPLSGDNAEECDDGNDDQTDSCTNECKFNVLGDGLRYVTKTIDSFDGALHECDTGDVEDSNDNRADYREDTDTDSCDAVYAGGTCDGDGYKDETDFCGAANDPVAGNRGKILCKANQTARGLTAWKSTTYCLMPAEAHGEHGDDAHDDLLRSDWYEAKAHCESYGIDARLVVVATAADRTALATTALAAGVAGISSEADVGFCEGSDNGDTCDDTEDCDGTCGSGECVGGADDGDSCTIGDDDCEVTCVGVCQSANDGVACDTDEDCDSDICAARSSWIGLYDDFTGEINGGVPVPTSPGRWYWLTGTLDDPANLTTHALWQYTAGPPQSFPYPNGAGDCGALNQGTDGTVTVATEGWYDRSCETEGQGLAYMCEFPL